MLYIKNEGENLLSNRDVILNKAKDYYQNDKERLRELAGYKSEEEKNIKREYGRNRYHNMSEEKKTKTKKISKNLSWG